MQKMSFFSYAGKFFLKNHSLFAQYIASQEQLHLGYMIPIRKGTAFISHYKFDSREKKSTAIVGVKQRYDDSEIIATINSRGKISGSLSLKSPTFGVRLCALVDYKK
jgi:hypothetical protein